MIRFLALLIERGMDFSLGILKEMDEASQSSGPELTTERCQIILKLGGDNGKRNRR